MGILYIVPTPIGNLEDMTLRGLRILREANLIAAEDTRTSRVLLNHFEIKTPMTSYHEHSQHAKQRIIFDALETGDVALISDAGTPGLSDPGYELVREAIQRGVSVVPLPGPSAAITALVASGLPTDSFTFLGFLPKKDRALRTALEAVRTDERTLILYESPHRLVDTLQAVVEVLGDRQVCVARELSKMFEEFHRAAASEALAHFSQENPRGEVTLVIAGAEPESAWDSARVLAALASAQQDGLALSKAARAVARASGWSKSDVYALGLNEDIESD